MMPVEEQIGLSAILVDISDSAGKFCEHVRTSVG
jgi:hypothetical protein